MPNIIALWAYKAVVHMVDLRGDAHWSSKIYIFGQDFPLQGFFHEIFSKEYFSDVFLALPLTIKYLKSFEMLKQQSFKKIVKTWLCTWQITLYSSALVCHINIFREMLPLRDTGCKSYKKKSFLFITHTLAEIFLWNLEHRF